jgi:hypothetical protein
LQGFDEIMVKKPKNSARPGRPAVMSDADKRTERIAIRAHPDLVYYLSAGAREEGLVRSVFIERILINYLNAMWGHQVVDNIGREVPDYIPPADGHRLPHPATRFGSSIRPPPPRIPVGEESHPKRRFKK